MRFLTWLIVILVALTTAVMVGGMLAPGAAVVERARVIDAPPAAIMRSLTDLERWQEWEPWGRSDPGMRVSYGEARRGVGASYAWSGEKTGEGRMEIVAIEPLSVEYRLSFGGRDGEPARSEIQLEPEGPSKTRVIWSFEAEFGSNPVSRLVGLLVDDMLGRYYEAGLENLEEVVEHRLAVSDPASGPAD